MITKPLRTNKIDWSNPIARGLVFYSPLNEQAGAPVDAVSGTRATFVDNPLWKSEGLLFNGGTDNVQFNVPDEIFTRPSGLTVLVIANMTVLGAHRCLVSKASGNGLGAPNPFMLYMASTGQFGCSRARAATNYGQTNTPGSVVTPFLGVKTAYAATYSDNMIHTLGKLYINGVSVAAPLGTAGTNGAVTGVENPISVIRDDNVMKMYGTTSCAMIWNRALSPDEVMAASLNPWQLIAQPSVPRVLWYPTTPVVSGGVFPLDHRIKTKPLRISKIDWSNPITQGMVGCIPFNEMAGAPKDVVTRSSATLTTNAAWSSGGLIRAANTITNLGTIPIPPFFATLGTGDFSMLLAMGAIPASYAGAGFCETSTVGTSVIGFLNATGNVRFRAYGASSTISLVTGGAIPLNKPTVLIGTRRGNTLTIYIDGVATTATQTATNVEALTTLNIGANNPGNGVHAGERQLVGFWNRALSPVEVNQLTYHPWQVLAQPSPSRLLQSSGTVTPSIFIGMSRGRILAGISRGRISCGY